MAVLTGVTITHQDIFPRQSTGLVRNAPVFKQADNGRNVERASGGVDLDGCYLFGRRNTLEDQNQGPAGGTDVDRLVTGIQHKDRLMKSILSWQQTPLFLKSSFSLSHSNFGRPRNR